MLAGHTQARELREWATAELKGYPRFDLVPEYRVINASILWDIFTPFRGVETSELNIQELPDFARDTLAKGLPLNQSVDELEPLVAQCEAARELLRFSVAGGDVVMDFYNRHSTRGQRVMAMYWAVHPAVVRGVLGQVRTALAELVAELRSNVGVSGGLPTKEQTDTAFELAANWRVKNSQITVVHATTTSGDIMPDGPRTTIKSVKATVKDSSGNVSIGSAHVQQASAEGVDLAKVREFVELVTQVSPTLGLGPAQQSTLTAQVADLGRAADEHGGDKGRVRKALDALLSFVKSAAPTAAQKTLIALGDDLLRQLGEDVAREIGH